MGCIVVLCFLDCAVFHGGGMTGFSIEREHCYLQLVMRFMLIVRFVAIMKC